MAFKPGIFSEKQIDVMANCDKTINSLVGSVRSGKTIASLIAFLIRIMQYPECNLMLVGKSDKTLYRNVLMPLKDIVRPSNFTYSRTIGEGTLYKKYHFYTAGAYDEKSLEKIQGITLALAYGDEVTTWPESFFQMLLSRLSEDNAKFIGTMNPEGPYHWFKTKFLDREKEISLKSWTFLIDENKNLPPEYIENLKKFYTGIWYKRYILAQWVLAEGAIYDMFSEERHVAPVTSDIWRNITVKYVSCDYGTNNPTVFQLWGTDGHKRYLKKEYYYDSIEEGKQKTDEEYAQDLVNFIGSEDIQSVIIDPSAASFKLVVNRKNIPVMDANNDVLDGIRDVSRELAQDLIQIDPSCKNYIREKYGYLWDVKAGQRGEDKPIKQHDHSCFIAGTLISTINGKVPIESIRRGDLVLTRRGFKEVSASGLTSESEEVLTLFLENGKSITATKQHPIYVIGKGYIPLDSIRYGDYLFVEMENKEYKMLIKSYSTGLNSEDTQVQKELNFKDTILQGATTEKKESVHYTGKYGNIIMVKFQKGITFITKMVTSSITKLKTLNVYPYTNTTTSMQNETGKTKISLNVKENTVKKSDHSPKNGMGQKKENNGTLHMVNKFLKTARNKKQCVSNVEKNLSIIPLIQKHASVQTIVNPRGEELLDSTMKQEFVNNVEKNLQQINIQKRFIALKVVHVKQCGTREKVYNLTVKDAHEYFANGILSHNCDCERYYVHTIPLSLGYIDESLTKGTSFASSFEEDPWAGMFPD